MGIRLTDTFGYHLSQQGASNLADSASATALVAGHRLAPLGSATTLALVTSDQLLELDLLLGTQGGIPKGQFDGDLEVASSVGGKAAGSALTEKVAKTTEVTQERLEGVIEVETEACETGTKTGIGRRVPETVVLRSFLCVLEYFVRLGGLAGPSKNPMPLGHELSGVVDALGAEVSSLALGTRVVLNPTACGNMVGKTFCPMGEAAVNPVLSTLKRFPDEYAHYIEHKHSLTAH